MNTNSPLVTDLYQLTMAHAAWRGGDHDTRVCFHLFFRKNPFSGGFALAAGLETALEYLEGLHFSEKEITYLATLTGADCRPLFHPDFLKMLQDFRFTCDVEAVPEGTPVFPHEPLLRVTGPWWQAQLVETALLNQINFQTLIATKAARICDAAAGGEVLEFGLRRAQGWDGALTASRAAYIGGCHATSNVLAGMTYGIPVRGTHANSWVMFYEDETTAFSTYAEAMPNNCVFLVDTYDTLAGVLHAIEIGRRLREIGQDLLGIRLDSGDLAWLSRQARTLLDEAGFTQTKIVASNDLDEELIESLRQQDAAIDVWGVGTKLITAYDQPALGGVYKVGAVQAEDGTWLPRIKLSEQSIKVTNPGRLQVRRFFDGTRMVADAIWNEDLGFAAEAPLHDLEDAIRTKRLPANLRHEDLLTPVLRDGRRLHPARPLPDIRGHALRQLECLDKSSRRIRHPHRYPAGVENRLWTLRNRLFDAAKGESE